MNMKRIGVNIAISILAILGILAFTAYATEIRDMKWNDSNGNAIKDPGELGDADTDKYRHHNNVCKYLLKS